MSLLKMEQSVLAQETVLVKTIVRDFACQQIASLHPLQRLSAVAMDPAI